MVKNTSYWSEPLSSAIVVVEELVNITNFFCLLKYLLWITYSSAFFFFCPCGDGNLIQCKVITGPGCKIIC